jgi:hypothetical protein
MWDRPNVSPRIVDVEMQGRRTRPTVIDPVAMLCLVAGCTAPAPERQPEATHSATPSPIEHERAIEDYIVHGSVALGTINSVIVEVDGIRDWSFTAMAAGRTITAMSGRSPSPSCPRWSGSRLPRERSARWMRP